MPFFKAGTKEEEEEALRRGLRLRHVEESFQLDFARADKSLFLQWEERLNRHPEFSLSRFETVPEHFLAPYAKILTRIENLMPDEPGNEPVLVTPESLREEEAENKEVRFRLISWVVQTPEGRLAALSRLGFYQEKADKVYQWQIGVLPEYQGKGLAKALLGASYGELCRMEPGPRLIEADTHPSNQAMKRLFQQLGFRSLRIDKIYSE